MSRSTGILGFAAACAAAAGALGCQDAVAPGAALVTGEYGITDIAVDDFFVYFAKADGTIKKVSLDGGPSTTIVSGIHAPRQIAVDQSDVYWATSDGTLASAPKDGGNTVTLIEGQPEIREFEIDDTHLYFTVGGTANAVRKVSKTSCVVDGCVVDTLAGEQSNPRQLAVERGWIYWENGGNFTSLLQMPVSGGQPALLADAQGAWDMAADGNYVYWLDTVDGEHGEVKLATLDGTDVRLIASGQSHLMEVAGDAINVYWTTTGAAPTDGGPAQEATLSLAPVEGGAEPTVLSSSDQFGPIFLALDATSIYWANSNAGTVFMHPKP